MKDDLTLLGNCTLDHDGCVVCSDAGIPVRVISIEADDALCEDAAGNQAEIAIELVAPVTEGEILLTHGGVAIAKVQKADQLKCCRPKGGPNEIRRRVSERGSGAGGVG